MSAIVDPITNPGAWDYVTLDGMISPGVCTVEGCDRGYKWDAPKTKGTTGGPPKFDSEEDLTPSLTLTLWEPSHFGTLENFLSVCRKAPDAKEPKVLPIDHPAFAMAVVAFVVVTKIGGLKHEGGGKFSIKIDLRESRAATAVAGSGTGGTAGTWFGSDAFASATDSIKNLFSNPSWP